LQVPVPLQSPPQPSKFDPASGVAVSATGVPCENVAWHVPPQSIPEGVLLTDPVPEPALFTVRLCVGTPTRPSASIARLVAPMFEPSSRPSWGHEPSLPCSLNNRSTIFAYQFDAFVRSGAM
jgi:hypothetical protein